MSEERKNVQAYHGQIVRLNILLTSLHKRRNLLAWLRFLSLAAAFAAAWLLWSFGLFMAGSTFIVLFGLFLRLVILDMRNKSRIENTNSLIEINEEEMKIAGHQFMNRDDGSRFLPVSHAYAADLDIFGRASLYQYTNRTTSGQGNQLYSTWLLAPSPEEDILQRQEAAKSLAEHVEWRQQLQAFGIKDRLTTATEEKINQWLLEENRFAGNKLLQLIRYLFPVISISSLLLCIAGILPTPVFLGIAFIFFILSGMISKNINPLYAILNKTAPEVDTLYDSIHWIETVSFHSGLLQKLQQLLKPGNRSSTAAIRQLNKILERFDVRLNPMVFIPLNIFVFWDLQQAFALEKWKSANKANLTVWFSVLGQIECISTLSAIAFNHPEWSFPALSSEPGTLTAAGMGHPLIESSKRVTNSFSTHGVNQLALITGSNMAGKSTFLRSIGINVVLAMMGAPVCAQSFSVHRMKIMSSMRIADNLEENTSTFYAELKKLKDIIEAVNRSEPVYILLDEILRGTNSLDRHTGSKALIRQLIHHKAVGMIATHDIELAKLAEEFAQNIHNYYFDVQVEHDELYFDYRLKEGICQSMNASILMKKIGIEL